MELTTRGRYAVMAMIDLAFHGSEGQSISLADIAKRQDISLSYLEQLFAKLRKGGIVDAKRGPKGGYKLAKQATEISISNIVSAVDENVKATACNDKERLGCGNRSSKCVAHGLWAALTNHIQDFLSDVTIADVLSKKFNKNQLFEAAE